MKYYVYFDAYGHAGQIIDENELAEKYKNDPDKFLDAMCQRQAKASEIHTTGHVGTLTFGNENELHDYLKSLGDEITGFFKGRSDNRPYNF